MEDERREEEKRGCCRVLSIYLSIWTGTGGETGGKDVGRRWGGEREAGGLIGRKLSARAILRRIRDSPGSYPSVRFRIPRACTSASSSHRRRAARGSHSRDRIAGPSPSSSSSLCRGIRIPRDETSPWRKRARVNLTPERICGLPPNFYSHERCPFTRLIPPRLLGRN